MTARRSTRQSQATPQAPKSEPEAEVQEVREAEVEAEATQEAAEVTETPEETIARLQRELAEAKASRPRKPRERKVTGKQLKFLLALHQNPDASLEDLVKEAGAGGVTEPHGFVYRLIANGYVRLDLPETVVKQYLAPAEAEGSTETPAEV